MSKKTVQIECMDGTEEMLSGLFQEMAAAFDAERVKQAREWDGVPEGYVQNAKGWMMPAASVKEKDKVEDGFVDQYHRYAAAVGAACGHLRLSAFSESDALVEMIVKDAGGDGSTERRKVTLQNLRATRRIVIDRRDTVAFGPEVQAAKEKVWGCVRKWGEGANQNIVALATMAFEPNGNGDLSVSKVAVLWRLDCQEPEWQDAMAALKDALRPTGTATYLRFHERKDPDGKWNLVEAGI